MAHLATINADGSPQVTVVWIGLEGDEIVTSHLGWYAKLRNMDRDPRVVISFDAPEKPGEFLRPNAVLKARARIEPSDGAWDLLDRMTKVYMGPDVTFPGQQKPGYIVRYTIDRIGGVGPWVPESDKH
jgi:PPOX class probable F420-dependent enzyme